MKSKIIPAALISEKDKTRIMNTLFKVKLLALVSQLEYLLRWSFFQAVKGVTILPGSCL